MKVKVNGMTFDERDPRCKIWIGSSSATQGFGEIKAAFITCIDDSTRLLKHYWGLWDWDCREGCIQQIMEIGGKWPVAFRDVGIKKSAQYE